jgi:hypothetical protein
MSHAAHILRDEWQECSAGGDLHEFSKLRMRESIYGCDSHTEPLPEQGLIARTERSSYSVSKGAPAPYTTAPYGS